MNQGQPQQMFAFAGGSVRCLSLPSIDAEVLPGVRWGAFDRLFTPAFWAGRVWLHALDKTFEAYRLGTTLVEELAACLLGGHGIPAEVGLAAYARIRDSGILNETPEPTKIEALLAQPLLVGGRAVRYRFARQKACYLADCLKAFASTSEIPMEDRELRSYLTHLPGIGPKTASWITRNWTGSDRVAILDIHICRACVAAGVFAPKSNPARDYFTLEERFLTFAQAINARASVLDNLMWQTMRQIGGMAISPFSS